MEKRAMGDVGKVEKKQFSGAVYSSFSEVPKEVIVDCFSIDPVIEGMSSKCQWYAQRSTQEEVTAKMTTLINLLSCREKISVLDYGGGVGQFLFSVEKYLTFYNTVTWQVLDTEPMIRIAKERIKGKDNLFFYKDLREIKDADLVFFRQSLQVLEDPAKILADIVRLFNPKIIFLSGVPAGKNEDYVGLVLSYGEENKGCPCWIFNEGKLLNMVSGLGYFLLDKFNENITINLSNFPNELQMDDGQKNHAKGYIFLREGAVKV